MQVHRSQTSVVRCLHKHLASSWLVFSDGLSRGVLKQLEVLAVRPARLLQVTISTAGMAPRHRNQHPSSCISKGSQHQLLLRLKP